MEEKSLPKPQTDLPLPEKELPAHTKQNNILKSKILIGFVLISTLVAFLIGGIMLGGNQTINDESNKTTTPSPTLKPENDQAVCTQEAKLCPDGSYVGRNGPNCEFDTCPTQ